MAVRLLLLLLLLLLLFWLFWLLFWLFWLLVMVMVMVVMGSVRAKIKLRGGSWGSRGAFLVAERRMSLLWLVLVRFIAVFGAGEGV